MKMYKNNNNESFEFEALGSQCTAGAGQTDRFERKAH